ncbi:MAG: prolipoprotein diacylglyceryl transferase [Candidatus Magasanikbacteria bacterium]|uniref:Phosphatidylglycerol--prolipoprotein diacylglyceryl transferase n=1 Tax=Candidatus Magasanikbacteria bacterium CG10_big_fil_rev_8_21_14_0_10_38_6 TaxID=1974647 RepID=A0A2M6P1N1_9BACT|nr:prolipoprotein diacylglyceryl transferase [Candidatus Magasanikbacteria bacterium]PIR77330.1 MAG: hypothetical protein COU30_03060 [Candidatus Magasanikbacteria bacterium CG10_big_fil_rev_8_21_14_0_10_38_6]
MIPWFQWTTIPLGPVSIQVWGLMVALGIFLSSVIITRVAKKKGFSSELCYDAILWMILFGILFSRVFHVLFYDIGFYIANPFEIIQLWHGGLSSFGGIFGAGVGLFLFWKKRTLSTKQLLPFLDILSFGAVCGWIIARFGCFFIHDHLGKESNNFFLAMKTPGNGSRYDMALLEIIGMLPLAFVFVVFRKKKLFEGWFLAVLFVYYGCLRFVLDFWRVDTTYVGLTPAQYFAMVLVAIGGYMFVKRGSFRK